MIRGLFAKRKLIENVLPSILSIDVYQIFNVFCIKKGKGMIVIHSFSPFFL